MYALCGREAKVNLSLSVVLVLCLRNVRAVDRGGQDVGDLGGSGVW